MHIIKTSPFQRDIIQYISESFLLMIRYLFKKGLTFVLNLLILQLKRDNFIYVSIEVLKKTTEYMEEF